MSLNLATTLRQSATRFPKRTAIISGDRVLDYDALHAQARKFAGALASLGIERGQHVALMLPNIPEFTIAYFGCHYAANPVVPLNILLKTDEIAYHIDDSDAVALVVERDALSEAAAGFERVPGCRHLIVVGAGASKFGVGFEDLVAAAEPVTEIPDTMPDDTAVILYTSGTTGKPKGAELTHFNLFYNAEYCAKQLVPIDHTSVALIALPLFHSFGQTSLHNASIIVGGAMVLMSRFDAKEACELMRRHKVTFFAGVPTMYFGLLHCDDADPGHLSTLTNCVSGGAPMPVEVMREFEARFSVTVLEGYGLSETSPVASFNVLDRPTKPGSIGVPIGGVEFKLVDDDGNVITDTDTRGEICIKGHNAMKGYYKRPDATAAAMNNGWLATGDIATRDEDGYYFIVDRKKDMILRGGFNVYPREIEEVLYAHEAVAEAAVIGIPDPEHGEEVKAFVALKDGKSVSGDEIIAFCKQRMAAYKYPRYVEFLETLPKGPTGKILKRALRK